MADSTKNQMHPNPPPPYNTSQHPNQYAAGNSYPGQPVPCQGQQMVYAQVPNPHVQQGYIPVAQPQHHNQPQLMAVPPMLVVGPNPTRVTCPSCYNQTVSKTESVNSSKTHLWAFVLCILGCWPCCLIPYCMDDCMSTNHYCSHCNAYLGRYQP